MLKQFSESHVPLPKTYILITCSEPSADGKLHVEMTYEGDACLAAYLLESAQGMIEDQGTIS